MTQFDKSAFSEFILENDVYGFFEEPITLKSGRQSHYYVNWRNVVEDAWLTENLVKFVIDFATDNKIEVDTFYGVPEGATKLGVLTQYSWAKRQENFGKGTHVLAMGRAKPKEHGHPKDRNFVGAPRGNVVVIEDTATTGGSFLKYLDKLREAQIQVTSLIVLTNRMEKRDDGLSVREAVEKEGIKFYNMSTALDLLPLLFEKLKPGDNIARAIESEYQQYGVEPLKIL